METSSDQSSASPDNAPVMWPRERWPLVVGLAPFLVAPVALYFLDLLDWLEWVDAHAIWFFVVCFGVLLLWLACLGKPIAKSFDYYLRTADFVLNRTQGGWLRGYSLPIVLWTTIVVLVVAFGPTQTWFNFHILISVPVIGAVTALAVRGFAWLSRKDYSLLRFTTVLTLSVIAFVVIWLWCRWNFFASAAAGERNACFPFAVTVDETARGLPVMQADYVLYPHTFLFFIGFVSILACASQFLASWMLKDFKYKYKHWTDGGKVAGGLLTTAELFVRPDPPAFGVGDVLRSAFTTPLGRPHLFLFPIAVAIFLAPQAYMNVAAVVSALAAAYFLALAGVHERLNLFLKLVQRNFFQGVLWGVSFLVIVLAACRFWEISYVATLIIRRRTRH